MNDRELRQLVIDELDWEPAIDSADIGVAVDNSIVTLSGHVRSFAEKSILERTVSRVKGVKAIALETEVRYLGDNVVDGEKIAERALSSLKWNALIPENAVQVKVERGRVTLTGQLNWQYQKEAAISAVRKLTGVTGVLNNITLKIRVKSEDVKNKITNALKRNAEIDANGIRVSVTNQAVTLDGSVRSWSERSAAERAAWSAPGVTAVQDYLAVNP